MTSSSDNYLTPANAFTVLALIGALRFPINKLGTLLGSSRRPSRASTASSTSSG